MCVCVGGGGGAYARSKNTSVRVCAKNAGGGGLCARAAYLRDTTVHHYQTCPLVDSFFRGQVLEQM